MNVDNGTEDRRKEIVTRAFLAHTTREKMSAPRSQVDDTTSTTSVWNAFVSYTCIKLYIHIIS